MPDFLTRSLDIELMLLGRLVAAALMTGALGWERELARKAAGLRTHMLVGIAAALFTALSEAVAARDGGAPADLLRTVQAVATGVGFLGAGVFFLPQGESRVRGLTTAASIWAASAVGMCAGAGLFVLGTGATLILLLVLHTLQNVVDSPSNDETSAPR